jgi:2,3-bisphosphoglycerate-independent phosphoglycerate mutase
MKYAIILPDGAADEPLEQLAGRTPLEAAKTPHMDWIASHGRLGLVTTVPAGYIPGTDVATLSLFGYDPGKFYSGRAPIEAAAQNLTAGPDELIFRCNFVTIGDGRMRDFTANHISQDEAEQLVAALNGLVASGEPAFAGCAFHAGVSYRNLMIVSGAADMELKCDPPHDIPNELISDHLPRGRGAERVKAIMDRAKALIADHEINRARAAEGRPPVSGIWLWGQGRPTRLTPFAERFGPQGVVITGVDIIRGLAVLMGMKLIEVPGATGYIDTDYAGKGRAGVDALRDYDLVVVHVEAPDEAGHLGDAAEKVTSLERVDELIVGPLLDALRAGGDWKIMVAPDHPTPVSTTAHSAEPPPFCFAGSGVEAVEKRPFSEEDARAGGFHVKPGHDLMQLFFEP